MAGSGISISCRPIARHPGTAEPAEHGRVDQKPAKRLDQGHVHVGESGYWLDVDPEVKTISARLRAQGRAQEGVDRGVANLAERLLAQQVEHAKAALPGARRDRGPRAELLA